MELQRVRRADKKDLLRLAKRYTCQEKREEWRREVEAGRAAVTV
jgi:hypothetical protein